MQRWQEEWEVKQAEFLHCIRWFESMADVWVQLSCSATSPGRAAYARRTSSMFREMARTARARFIDAGYGDRLSPSPSQPGDGRILADWIQKDRADIDNQILKDLQVDTHPLVSHCIVLRVLTAYVLNVRRGIPQVRTLNRILTLCQSMTLPVIIQVSCQFSVVHRFLLTPSIRVQTRTWSRCLNSKLRIK